MSFLQKPEVRARIKSFLRHVTPLSELIYVIDLFARGYVVETGWRRSVREQMPVDSEGAPLPWLTYPAIAFLEKRLSGQYGDLSVFEYGSGQSTLWWSRRVRRLVSCEHDAQWHARLQGGLSPNVEYLHRELESGYARTLQDVEGTFDVIVIDGRQRVACAEFVAANLSERGIVIWDNSERAYYRPGIDKLRAQGFRDVEFSGIGPVGRRAWSTSIFYRSDNLLGL